MINPNTLAIDRKGGKREKGGGGMESMIPADVLKFPGRVNGPESVGFAPFRVCSSRLVRRYYRQEFRGRYRVSPCVRGDNGAPRGKIGTALSSCPRHHPCHPFFAECSKSSGEGVQTGRKQSRRAADLI